MKQHKSAALWIVIFLFMLLIVKLLDPKQNTFKNISYAEFIVLVEQKKIEEVVLKEGDQTILGKFKPEYENGKRFRLTGSTGTETFKILRQNGITPNYEKPDRPSMLTNILINWGPALLLIAVLYFVFKQLQAGGGKAMSFGKSRARMVNENDKKVNFSNVAGVEEAKEELVEIVDFLKDPQKYTALGGKIPKGVLLVGPPGTGKTLLARAVAGEADVPFFSISGSDFVEMFVGVGASRVRDLFDQGKKNAPCIIFIDEIDAVGRHRGAGLGGGHDEREQTLNQLLVEMDGFEANSGVILIAATNRQDVLDPALLRPGRFDRRVVVGRPDVRGRHGILEVHTKNSPLEKDVDLEILAKGTPGFTGADLANLVNEAALQAARVGKTSIGIPDFEEAKDKVLMGTARKSMAISDAEKKNTAYHEAGHTIVGLKLDKVDPIHKVTIIPRGQALGVTQTLPEEDTLSLNTERASQLIAFMMGGRCAEEIIFSDKTNGASNDIERATEIARNMVCKWGMSQLGPINLYHEREQPFAGMGQSGIELSDSMTEKIDREVHRIIDENYRLATKILEENKDALIRLSETLIVWETLDSEQILAIMDGKDIGVPLGKTEGSKTDEASSTSKEELAQADDKQKESSTGENSDESDPLKMGDGQGQNA